MIYSAISTIGTVVNDYIQTRFGLAEDIIVVSNLVKADGTAQVTDPDKIIMSLVNLQQEIVNAKGSSSYINRPVNLNLFVLFSAFYEDENYMEGLKYLSGIISFFQSNKVLTHSNTPDLDDQLDKLTFEIVNQDLQTQSYLWGMIGAKYMPSILYKVRMVTFQEGFTGNHTPFSGFASNINPAS